MHDFCDFLMTYLFKISLLCASVDMGVGGKGSGWGGWWQGLKQRSSEDRDNINGGLSL